MGRVEGFDSFYIFFFFLLKVVPGFTSRLEQGFGFPEELQPCWDDKASIQVDTWDGTGAPGGPRKVLFYKGKKKKGYLAGKKPNKSPLCRAG